MDIRPGNADDAMMNNPIRISDVASMFRRPISKNERPLEKAVLSRNNDVVDRWYKEVLIKLADKDGTIPVRRVTGSFQYFTEGNETAQFQKYKEYLPSYTEEQVMFWIDFLTKKEIEELHECGIGVISGAWQVITGALRNHFAQRRWEAVYSKTDLPIEWDRLANDNPHTMNGRPLPFGLSPETMKEMEDKIRVILQNPIQPK